MRKRHRTGSAPSKVCTVTQVTTVGKSWIKRENLGKMEKSQGRTLPLRVIPLRGEGTWLDRCKWIFTQGWDLAGARDLSFVLTPISSLLCTCPTPPLLGTSLPGFRDCNPPWLRLSERPWDPKPLRRQSLSPWQGCSLCSLYPAWPPVHDWLANDG